MFNGSMCHTFGPVTVVEKVMRGCLAHRHGPMFVPFYAPCFCALQQNMPHIHTASLHMYSRQHYAVLGSLLHGTSTC